MVSKAKKNRPVHVGRPTYQLHEEGKWNHFDSWLHRRTVRTGYNAPPVEYGLFRCDWKTPLPSYWHDPRHLTKKKARGAGSARRVKTSVTRGYRKTAPRFDRSERQENFVSRHELSKHNTQIHSNEKLDETDEDHAKKEQLGKIFSVPILKETFRELSIQDSGKVNCSKGYPKGEEVRKDVATQRHGYDEDGLFSPKGLHEMLMESLEDRASLPLSFKKYDDEWVDVKDEDAFEILGEEGEDVNPQIDDEWDVICGFCA